METVDNHESKNFGGRLFMRLLMGYDKKKIWRENVDGGKKVGDDFLCDYRACLVE